MLARPFLLQGRDARVERERSLPSSRRQPIVFHGDLKWGGCMDQSFQFDVHCFAKHVGNVVYVSVIKLALNDPGWLQEAAANEAQVQFNDTVSTEAMKSATRQWMRHMDAAHVERFLHM